MTHSLEDSTQEQITEDPLAGDVDKFVHPDETRSDAQIAHDEGVASRLHMSGDDGADEYWADYDEYNGTVNGGEDPLSVVQEGEQPVGIPAQKDRWKYLGMMTITSPKGRELSVNRKGLEEKETEGISAQEIGRQYDAKHEEDAKIVAEYREKQRKLYAPKPQDDWDERYEDEEYENEDPLAGDVDRWVDPNETKDY